jgi:hypothetical protein
LAALPHRKPASTGISHNGLIAAVLKTVTKEMHLNLNLFGKFQSGVPTPIFPDLFKIHAFVL